jgi:hypothetical protein
MIDHLMRGSAGVYTPTSPYKLKLFSTEPDYDAGTGGTEMVATGYTAGGQSVALTAANWNAAADQGNGKRVSNIVVPSWTAGAADWEAVLGEAFFDNGGTNLLWGKTDDHTYQPGNGDTFRFSAAALKFDLDTTTLAGISNFWKAKILDHVWAYSDRPYSAPATAYMALFTGAPNFITGAGGTECAAGDYARKSITMNATWDAADANGVVDNTGEIAFTPAVADWGTIVAAMLVSTASGAFDAFAGKNFTGVAIGPSDTFRIAAGDFDVSLL